MAILTDDNYVDKAEQVMLHLGEPLPEYELDYHGKPKKDFNNRKIIKKDKNGKNIYKKDEFSYKLTSSKIRGLLALTSNLYDESNNNDYGALTDKIAYLRVQFVYQAGREAAVKALVEKAQILEILKEVQDKRDIATLQRFCRYMEALVAYFKYYGGKD